MKDRRKFPFRFFKLEIYPYFHGIMKMFFTSSSLRLKFSMLKAYTVTSLTPNSRHHCRHSDNFSNPLVWPTTFCTFVLAAYRRFPSIMKAIWLGIGPHFKTFIQNFWNLDIRCSAIQDILVITILITPGFKQIWGIKIINTCKISVKYRLCTTSKSRNFKKCLRSYKNSQRTGKRKKKRLLIRGTYLFNSNN